jgi:hypothetical protein
MIIVLAVLYVDDKFLIRVKRECVVYWYSIQ